MISAVRLPDASGMDVMDFRGQRGHELISEFKGVKLER